MERLNLKECENCKGWNGCISNCFSICGKPLDALKEFKELKDLEEEGRLLKLPCTVGDKIWDNDFGELCSYTVSGFSFGDLNDLNDDNWEEVLDQIIIYYTNSNGSVTGSFAANKIGETVFLSREDAKQAIGKENSND